MIKEDYVSFEIAKLLKERGFDGEYHKRYWGFFHGKEYLTQEGAFNPKYDYAAPTLHMTTKWLREVHNIFISIDIYSKDFEGNIRYCANIYKYGSRMILDTPIICDTYKETCEAAIKYSLENLI